MVPVFEIAFDIGKFDARLFVAEMALSTVERYVTLANHTSNDC